MATHVVLPAYQQQQLQQQDQEQLRAGGWLSSGPWGPTARCHNLQGAATWSTNGPGNAAETDSWEIRAFAEDASSSGQWPPRSYACSFCQREFRTAQALGGHMNVHRRERAHANQMAQLRNAATLLSSTPVSVVNANGDHLQQPGNGATSLCWLYPLPQPGANLRQTNGPERFIVQNSASGTLLAVSNSTSNGLSLPGLSSISQLSTLHAQNVPSTPLSSSSPVSNARPLSQESITSNSLNSISSVVTDNNSGRKLSSPTTAIQPVSFLVSLPQATPGKLGAFHRYAQSSERTFAQEETSASAHRQTVNFSNLSPSLVLSETAAASPLQENFSETLDLELRLGHGPRWIPDS